MKKLWDRILGLRFPGGVWPVLLSVLLPTSLPADENARIVWEKAVVPAGGAKGFVELADGEILAARTVWRKEGVSVVCSRSRDGGRTWQRIGPIVRDPQRRTDLGDGHLLQLADGRILYCYRHNKYRDSHTARPSYSIRVAASEDRGQTWTPHSTVHAVQADAGAVHPSRGLWASFLLEKTDGSLQCYFDDEDTPFREGFPGHQWLRMKTWDPQRSKWGNPVTVSRAFDRRHLSRDGMGSVVELPSNRLLCALESCRVNPPHANVIRYVLSEDGGRTWSWQRSERAVLYQPAKRNFMAVSPWMIRWADGPLACVFATDEDREFPDQPGTPVRKLNMDVKLVLSTDGGRTWSKQAQTVYDGSHKSYMPGIAQLKHGPSAGSWLVLFYDTRHGHLARRGSW